MAVHQEIFCNLFSEQDICFFLHVSRQDPLGCWVHSAQEGQQQVADCKLP